MLQVGEAGIEWEVIGFLVAYELTVMKVKCVLSHRYQGALSQHQKYRDSVCFSTVCTARKEFPANLSCSLGSLAVSDRMLSSWVLFPFCDAVYRRYARFLVAPNFLPSTQSPCFTIIFSKTPET